MKKEKLAHLVQSGIIAAVYAALTLLFSPLSFGLSQLRVSEGLCILPHFTPAAVPGLVSRLRDRQHFWRLWAFGYCLREFGDAVRGLCDL